MFPDALDCTSGKPDPALFPLEIIKRAWRRAIDETDNADLQYAGPEPVPTLAAVLEQRLRRDAIRTGEAGLVIGSSAQQLMMLSQSIISMISDVEIATIVVEEPGFQTVFDALERHGARLEGAAVDEFGVDPGSLDATLSATNAQAVLFTQRAQNPTGSSWSAERRLAIANVLARHPQVIVIEDDQFADLALTSPGSLINDTRLEDRVIYIRSFAKTIAPDLRLAAALAKPRLRNLLAEAKSYYDGWSSRLAQRTLAHILLDPEVDIMLDAARSDYTARRVLAVETLATRLGPIGAQVRSSDGLNIWISLPPGVDASEITERAAELGVLVVSGEPFFIHPGNNRTIRMSISQLDLEQTAVSANRLADAALNSSNTRTTVFPI